MGQTHRVAFLPAAAFFALAAAAGAVPPNDDCSQAIPVTLPAFSDIQDTDVATVAAGDRSLCGCSVNSNSVWYSVESPDPVTVVARTLGSSYDTVLDVFEGTCAAPQSVGCSDQFGGTNQSQVTFSACPGRSYLIQATDWCSEGGGSLRLDASSTSGAGDRDSDGLDDCTDNCPRNANATQVDTDGDGVGDVCDNCPIVPNPDQADTVPGGGGDACQGDFDGDGILDGLDNCRNIANPGQEDADGDTKGDVCDVCPGFDDRQDADFDGAPDACDSCTDPDFDGFGSPGFPVNTCPLDNCPSRSNPGQQDGNGNGIGDACDDRDGDGDFDSNDNCIEVPNGDQRNADGDSLGDACDACTDPDADGFGSPGLPASTCPVDNCPTTPNPDQLDGDGDGKGDACFVCTALGPLARYPTLASKLVRTKQIVTYEGYYVLGTEFSGAVCTPRAVFQGTRVTSLDDEPGMLVTTKRTGSAVRWSPHKGALGGYEDIEPENEVDDALITGGGRVNGTMDGPPPLIDTTGTRPEVAECDAAIAAMATASATMAARPPRLVLGKVFAAKDQQMELDLRGGGVVQIEDLAVEGTKVRSSPDSYGVRSCSEYGGSLVLRVGAGEQLVINVTTRLDIGNCSEIAVERDGGWAPALVVLNVVGIGPRVRIGVAATAYDGINILAPLRKIEVVGDGSGESAEFGRILGKKLLVRGFAYQTDVETICP